MVFEKGSGISDGKIEVAGGTVKINSTNIGMYTAVEDIILNGGKIEITSDNIALRAVQGNINLTGADIGIKAPTPTSAGRQVIGTFHDIHQWDSEWSYDDEGHWKACTNPDFDAQNEYAVHTGGTATCTEKAMCEICTGSYGEINVANHTNLVKTEAKQPTHLEAGNKEYWYCDDCNKYFGNEAGTDEISLADTVIPKLSNHTADDTGWHNSEANHWNICECGEVINKAAHSFEWVIDKKATSTEAGAKHEECTVCGYEKAAVEILVLGTTDPTDPPKPTDSDKETSDTGTTIPKTGDSGNLALWATLLLASGGALTAVALYSRKRRKTE